MVDANDFGAHKFVGPLYMAAELMIGTFAAVGAWIAPDTFEIS
jgi:hypothetical protein